MRTLCAAALVFVPAVLWAAPAPPDQDAPAASPAEQVRQALDKPLTLRIDKQPLSTAIDMLHEKTKVRFLVDAVTIQQQLGVTPDQPPVPVEIDVTNVKARVALRAVLATYGLSYAILGDTVVVTTEDAAEARQMRQRVSVDLDRVDLAAALKRLGRESAVNIVLDSRAEKEAKATVSLQIDDVPFETAVRLLTEMAGLKALRVGNVLFVTRKETAAELRGDPDFAPKPQPAPAASFDVSGVGVGALGALGGVAAGPVFVTPAAPAVPPVVGTAGAPVFVTPAAPIPPTVPPVVGPAPAPPPAGPAPLPPAAK